MRIVVKVGSSTLSHITGRLNIRRVEALCKTLADIQNAGHQVLLVSSGAIAMGVGKLNLPQRPTDIESKQAAAAVGQCELMYTYDKLFSGYHHTVGQVLITGDDIADAARSANVDATLNRLLDFGVIPIINENDTVATQEINSVGDNDTLASIVAVHCKADLLVLLSDIDGLYTTDPHNNPDAKLISRVSSITPQLRALAGDSAGTQGTGGMVTKLNAAETALRHGITMVIANGSNPGVLYDIVEGKEAGTRFVPEEC